MDLPFMGYVAFYEEYVDTCNSTLLRSLDLGLLQRDIQFGYRQKTKGI